MRLKDFNETFKDELRDPQYAAAYLEETLEDGLSSFLIALRDVIQANGGMTSVAENTSLGRESLYKALSETGNPHLRTIQSVLHALGLRLSITSEQYEDDVSATVNDTEVERVIITT